MRKVYVHLGEEGAVRLQVEAGCLGEQLLDTFVRKWEERKGERLVEPVLKTMDGKVVSLTDSIDSVLTDDQEDLYVYRETAQSQHATEDTGDETHSLNKGENATTQEPVRKESEEEEEEEEEEEMGDLLKEIRQNIDDGMLGVARDKCLEVQRKSNDSTHLSQIYLAKILVELGRETEAQRELSKVPGHAKQQRYEVYEILGDIFSKKAKYDHAAQAYNEAISLLAGKDETEFIIQARSKLRRKSLLEVKLCRALLAADRKPQAFELLERVTYHERDSEVNLEARLLYADCFIQHGRLEDGLKVVLKTLTDFPEYKPVRKEVSKLFREKKDLMLVMVDKIFAGLVGDTRSNVFAFLANTARDYGAVSASRALYERACAAAPNDPASLLGFVHILELDLEYTQALETILCIVESPPKGLFTPLASCCSIAAKILGDYLAFDKGNLAILKQYKYSMSVIKRRADQRDKKSDDDDEAEEEVVNVVGKGPVPLTTTTEPNKKDMGRGHLQKTDLDMLALLYTLIKIMFQHSESAAQFLMPLFAHLEPLRNGQKLHLTFIRNEHAYFQLIKNLVAEWPQEEDMKKVSLLAKNKMYVFGDSHTLPLAWRHVIVSGKNYVLHPKLATGVKAWHMRKESHFYPSYQFNKVAETIPVGAHVISLFCEIDCREGLVLALQKGLYDDFDSAMKTVVDIYIGRLLELERTKQWKIFVHPVVPVLDITRSTVLSFTHHLKNAVQAQKGKLYWLEFSSDLLEEKQGELNDNTFLRVAQKYSLKDQYKLDGTHLHPNYVDLLEKAIQQAME